MSDKTPFVHLRIRSEYSLLEGALRISELPSLCAENGMPAVAVADNSNLFGALEFASTLAASGVQPIHGCQLSIKLEFDELADDEEGSIVLLAQNEVGYGNLLALNSLLYVHSEDSRRVLTLAQLRQHSVGLICLTGGAEGPVGRYAAEGRDKDAEVLLLALAEIFPHRTYVEIQRHHDQGSDISRTESVTEPVMLRLAYEHQLPLVATNDVHFPKREMYPAHDAFLCIAQGTYVDQKKGRRRLTPEHYFKSPNEMAELFADIPEAISNTIEIAQRCSFWALPREPILPKFTKNETDELTRQAKDGLKKRLDVIEKVAPETAYRQRLDYELKVIREMGFAGYFLIVADFIKWAKQNGIPVGAGRGSGAGSLVAYSLTITDLDPLRFDLIFERFLNPERISMPDFDIDFCQERRDEVIRYVQDKYGSDRVAHIITFGAMMSRAAIRDVGRVLRIPFSKVDTIAKLIPREGANPLSIGEALAREPRLQEFYDSDASIKQMFDFAQELEGLPRNASTHAAGVVIGDRPLDQMVPLYRDPKSTIPATQFSMKWVEKAGLVKFDFLGLKTLTGIKKTVDLLAERGVKIDINNLNLDDAKTFKMCAEAETVAVFQLESSGMKDTLCRLKPTRIEDIVALVALYRPGPMQNIPTYCDVKNNKKNREEQHESIDHIVAETHGIMVYQEQVMQIAQSMAGYSLGQADLLRRAIGKKLKEDMDVEKPKFMIGAEKNGVDSKTADGVWELMARFAEYGFPKAHAAAYALVSYQTAYLKANHPVEFMASIMNCDIGDIDKLKVFVNELKHLDIELCMPCVNRCGGEFAVQDGKILYGLRAIRNIGTDTIKIIVDGRDNRPFTSLFDFADRVNLKHVGTKPLECLAQAGAFDAIEPNRRQVFESIDLMLSYSQTVHHERESDQISLFDESGEAVPPPDLPNCAEWSGMERSERELLAIGFYLSGHPLEDHLPSLRAAGVILYEELLPQLTQKKKPFLLAGKVSGIQQRTSQNGNKYAFLELSDPSGSFEVTVFSELLEKCGIKLQVGVCVKALLTAHRANGQTRLTANVLEFFDATKIKTKASLKRLRIHYKTIDAPQLIRQLLDSHCQEGERQGEVWLCPMTSGKDYEIIIKVRDKYTLNSKVKRAIASLEGIVSVDEY